MSIQRDIDILKPLLAELPVVWDGKGAILEMKERGFQWRQMEWAGFYFELLCRDRIGETFAVPGKKYGKVSFDFFGAANWDMKAIAIKTDRHSAILNDIAATDASVAEFGAHGIVMALIDVEYNDEDRTFQKWHSQLKGGLSDYAKERMARNATSRYRKTSAILRQILFLSIDENNINKLGVHAQGRNSDGSPRNPKYLLNIEKADEFELARIDFESPPMR